MHEKNKKNIAIIFKHMIVSTLSVCVEITIFWMINVVGNYSLLMAHVIAFVCASMLGFALHSLVTFSVGSLKIRNAVYFCIQAIILVIIGYQILKTLVTYGIEPLFAKLIQLSINFCFSVVIGKNFTFKK